MDVSALVAVLAWGALKGALLLAAAGAVATALRGASAAARHAVWTVALGAALVLPAADALVPAWRLALLPPAEEVAAVGAASAGDPGSWIAAALLLTWLLGVFAVSLRWMTAAAAARRLVSRSVPMRDVAWCADVDRVSRGIGLRRPVELRTSGTLGSPVTWGVRRQVLLLPAGSESWDEERRVAVLMHELSHVRRRDCLTGLLAEAACALHWFNPLAWIAYRRLHVERERACDDGVLFGGLRASQYAAHLLSVARDAGARQPAAPRVAPALARASEMEERIRAMLDGRARSGPLSRAKVISLACVALVATATIGSVEPVRRAAMPGPRPVGTLSEFEPLAVVDEPVALAPLADLAVEAPRTPAPRLRRPVAAPRVAYVPTPPPTPAAPPEPPAPPSPHFAAAPAPVARVLTWRAPSGPSASDEPWRVARVVRVMSAESPGYYTFVLPDLPASVWRERSDEVWAYVERSIAREVHARVAAGPPALGVRADRFVVAVRRSAGPTSVDSAAHRGYRAARDEEAARTKAGT